MPTPAALDKLSVRAFHAMFAAIGLKWTSAATAKREWYRKHTWTLEQEARYRVWLERELRNAGLSKHRAKYEAGMFLLSFGWRSAP